jgi:hypothetical protein
MQHPSTRLSQASLRCSACFSAWQHGITYVRRAGAWRGWQVLRCRRSPLLHPASGPRTRRAAPAARQQRIPLTNAPGSTLHLLAACACCLSRCLLTIALANPPRLHQSVLHASTWQSGKLQGHLHVSCVGGQAGELAQQRVERGAHAGARREVARLQQRRVAALRAKRGNTFSLCIPSCHGRLLCMHDFATSHVACIKRSVLWLHGLLHARGLGFL